ncbi:MAG: hypothetical protein AAF968_10450 [Pseudomonadota bacterium]
MRRTALALVFIASTAGTAPVSDAAAGPLPRYLIAVWDGKDTGPGLWFAAKDIALATDLTLSPVTALPVGTVIGAEAGQLSVSSAMAAQFGMRPGEPILVEVHAGPATANRPSAIAEEQSPEVAATARRDRIRSLLGELREAAAAKRQALEGAVQ